MNDKEIAEYILGESARAFITEGWLDPESIKDVEFRETAERAYELYYAFRDACFELDAICERFANE